VIPTPICDTTYWHRSLNPKKLIEVGFSSKRHDVPLARYIKSQRIVKEHSVVGIRPLEKKDCKVVRELLNNYLKKFKLHINFTEKEFMHFFMPQDNVIESFVVESKKGDDPKSYEITDFMSFYSLPSSVLKHPNHNTLRVAYSFYSVPGKYKMVDLAKSMLILAQEKGYDVFNALDIQQNKEYLEELRFGVGDGCLHYYLYNWRVHKMVP